MTITELSESFTQHLHVKNYSPLTIASYNLRLRTFFAFLKEQGIKNIEKVSPMVVREYQQHLEARYKAGDFGVWDYCIKVRSVKRLFKFLEETEQVLVNHALLLEEPDIPKQLHKTPLTHEEALKVLELPDLATLRGIADRCILQLLYANGVRVGELVELKMADLDLESGYLRVSRGKQRRSRTLPLTAQTIKFLKAYLDKVRTVYLSRKGRESDYLFINRLSNPTLKGGVEFMVRRLGKRAGIAKPVTPHIFRHTFCNELLKSGAEPQVVADLMGHVRPDVLQVYSQPLQADVKKTMEEHHPMKTEEGKADDGRDAGPLPA